MSRLLSKPSQPSPINSNVRFQRFNLTENPFPPEPMVNQESSDKRINGYIYEIEIRRNEFDKIQTSFLSRSKISPSHLRLGYIVDTSYIGRGNGKSAFLINLQQKINKNYCLDLSEGLNKCFSVIVTPEPGGRTKTFPLLVDVIFNSLLKLDIINYCLASIKLQTLLNIEGDFKIDPELLKDENNVVSMLNSKKWFADNNIDLNKILKSVYSKPEFQDLPPDFPLFKGKSSLFSAMATQEDFENYYMDTLRRKEDKIDFVFSHLVRLFQAANFNGAFILIDDFERIPDFQSARQKKDFALELRSAMFDGSSINARIGFYTFFFVLHAGVHRLISDAWTESGMENRSPIAQLPDNNHIIPFEKLNMEHAFLLIKKYLDEFRIDKTSSDHFFPFSKGVIKSIGEMSEYNASKMLKMAFELLEKAIDDNSVLNINNDFFEQHIKDLGVQEKRDTVSIMDIESTDLLSKAYRA